MFAFASIILMLVLCFEGVHRKSKECSAFHE